MLPCRNCGEDVQVPIKLKDNCDKLKGDLKTLWVLCDAHPRNPATYYWHADKKLVCMECFTENNWSTKNMTMVQPHQVEDYCNRLLEKLFEIKVRAQQAIESVTSYRDKTKPFDSIEFIEMVDDTFKFLAPNAANEEEKLAIDFHRVPTALPKEIQIPEVTINPNPLGVDEYAVELFGMGLPV